MPQPEPGTPCERKPTGFNGHAANASPASLFRRNQRVVQRLCALVGLARAQAFGPGGECRALRDRAEGQAEVHLAADIHVRGAEAIRSEEHTSELQSLMRISYAVFCLKQKNHITTNSLLHILYTQSHITHI